MKKNSTIDNKAFILLALTMLFGQLAVPDAYAQEVKPELPKGKQTSLGLYVTSAEAYEMWKADPENVNILDVRTPEEYIFIGHAAMAVNIPAFLQTYNWDSDKKHFAMKPNPDFLELVQETFQPDDIILITCRSGGRSAIAVNKLAEAGYKNVYNITDGFEGDHVKDTESVFVGKRMQNGWKNSGAPWTYSLDPEIMRIPDSR